MCVCVCKVGIGSSITQLFQSPKQCKNDSSCVNRQFYNCSIVQMYLYVCVCLCLYVYVSLSISCFFFHFPKISLFFDNSSPPPSLFPSHLLLYSDVIITEYSASLIRRLVQLAFVCFFVSLLLISVVFFFFSFFF